MGAGATQRLSSVRMVLQIDNSTLWFQILPYLFIKSPRRSFVCGVGAASCKQPCVKSKAGCHGCTCALGQVACGAEVAAWWQRAGVQGRLSSVRIYFTMIIPHCVFGFCHIFLSHHPDGASCTLCMLCMLWCRELLQSHSHA